MNSASKRKLTQSELAAVIQTTFGDEVEIVSTDELTHGWCNTGYKVTLGGATVPNADANLPRRVVVKVAPADGTLRMRCERNIMQAEVDVLRLMRSHSPVVPVPTVYLYDASRGLVDAQYFIMECMPGKPYSSIKDEISEEEKHRIERSLGRYNRIINEPTGRMFGYVGQADRQTNTWRDAFLQMMDDVLMDGTEMRVELPVAYQAIRHRLDENVACLDEVSEPRLVHWDLWDGNVMVEDNEISGILDFERAVWGDPLMEFYFGHFTPQGAFTEGYGRSITTDSERLRRWLYDLYLDLILVIECTYRGYEDHNHIEWTMRNLTQTWRRY